MVIDAFELFKSPAGEFDYDIVTVGNIFVQSAVFAAGKLTERKACRELGGYKSDRETGRFGRESGGTGCSGVDLDYDDAPGLGIMRELHIRAADNADMFDDLVGLFLKLLLQILVDREHRSRTERVACVDTDRIDILDEADGDHIVVLVADDFELKLFPSED